MVLVLCVDWDRGLAAAVPWLVGCGYDVTAQILILGTACGAWSDLMYARSMAFKRIVIQHRSTGILALFIFDEITKLNMTTRNQPFGIECLNTGNPISRK